VRVLLDEQLPLDLAAALQGHSVDTVVGRGWAGITNGELLRRMRGEYEALVTMDQGIEFQQNLTGLPFGVLLLRAPSNRMVHLQPLVPAILDVLSALKPGQFHRIGV
jgi:predicted nuclease of predicted toxin-antitoxin system